MLSRLHEFLKRWQLPLGRGPRRHEVFAKVKLMLVTSRGLRLREMLKEG